MGNWMSNTKQDKEPCYISFPPTEAQCSAVAELLDRKGMIVSGTVDIHMPDGTMMSVDKHGQATEVVAEDGEYF